MICEDNMIVELFADYPKWVDWIFQILAHVELLVCLVYSKESELGFLGDAFEGYLVQVCDAVEYV